MVSKRRRWSKGLFISETRSKWGRDWTSPADSTPGGAVLIGDLGRHNLWTFFRRVRSWLGARFWRETHFWTVGELRTLAESARLQFCKARCAVYYPPSRIIANWLAPFDRPLSTITSTGAAFLCVRAGKPPVIGNAG